MTTLTQFAGKMAKAPAQFEAVNRKIVAAAALAITTTVRAEIAIATHGSNRLSGVGRKGVKVGVGYDIKGTANPTALVQARGALHLIERNAKPHDIRPRKRGGKRALGNESKGFAAASAHHPGTTGKHPFEKGVAAGVPVAMKAASTSVAQTLVKVVKG